MSDFEPSIPAYYVVGKKLDDNQLGVVRHALNITPIAVVLVTDVHDNEVALKIHDNVRRVATLPEAYVLAKAIYQETGERVAIIGDAILLDAYDANGNLQVRQEWSEISS